MKPLIKPVVAAPDLALGCNVTTHNQTPPCGAAAGMDLDSGGGEMGGLSDEESTALARRYWNSREARRLLERADFPGDKIRRCVRRARPARSVPLAVASARSLISGRCG